MHKFNWWRDKDNRDGATAIIGILKVVIPALIVGVVAVGGWLGFVKQDDGSNASPTVECNSTFSQNGDGNLIQNCGDGTVVIGLTQDNFFAELERREGEIRADLERATSAEKKLLTQELEIVRLKMANVEEAYAQTVEELRQLRLRLSEFEDAVPRPQLEAAQQALFEGNRKLADDLLAEVQEQSADAVILAADAAFLRGEIAEQEVRWSDAARHYADAARLNPTFDTLFNVREFMWRSGQYRKAVRFGEELLEVARNSEDVHQLPAALNEHAISLYALGLYEKAEPLYREALEIDRSTIGVEHPEYATRLNNLALLLLEMGRYDESETLYREALEIGRKTIGVEHPDYAIRLNNLAGLLDATGRYDEAERLYRNALEIDRKALGVEHPSYAIRLNNLAGLLETTGRSDEAEPLFREALEIDRKTIGDEHPVYASHLNNLAGLLLAEDRYDEAEPLFREALGIVEKALGAEHPNTVIVRENLDDLLANKPG